jgi:hypothetical protein
VPADASSMNSSVEIRMLGISSSILHKMCGRKMIAERGESKGMLEVREISQFALAGFSASSAVSQRPPRFRTLLFLKFYPNLKTQRSPRRAAECAEIAIAREKRDECPTPFGTLRSSAQGGCFPSCERTSSKDHDQAFFHFTSSATRDTNAREGRRSRNYTGLSRLNSPM